MYKIIGRIGIEEVSIHYSSDREYVDKVNELGSIRLRNGRILKLEVKAVDQEGEHKEPYVRWIKDCIKYGVRDCKEVPEFY